MTSAPKSPRTWVSTLPAKSRERSSTRMPCNGSRATESQSRCFRGMTTGSRRGRREMAGDGEDRTGVLDEGGIDHPPVDGEHAGARSLGGIDDAPGEGDLVVGGTENLVGQGDLARVDASFTQVAEAFGGESLSAVTIGILDVPAGRVAGPDAGLAGGQADGELDLVDGRGVSAVDAERFEKIREAELQAGDARVGAGDLSGKPETAGRFDIGEDSDGPGQTALRLQAGAGLGRGADIAGGFHPGPTD